MLTFPSQVGYPELCQGCMLKNGHHTAVADHGMERIGKKVKHERGKENGPR